MLRNTVSFLLLMIFACGCSTSDKKKMTLENVAPPFAKTKVGASQVVLTKPTTIGKNGIFFGDKGLRISQKGGINIVTGGKRLGGFFYYYNTPHFSYIVSSSQYIRDKKVTYSETNKSITYSGRFPLHEKGASAEQFGAFQQTFTVLDNGLIEVNIENHIPADMQKTLRENCLFFEMPFAVCEGGEYVVDGKKGRFDAAVVPLKNKEDNLFTGKCKSIDFFPDLAANNFSFKFLTQNNIWFRQKRLKSSRTGQAVIVRVYPDKGQKIKFLLDLRKVKPESMTQSTDCHAGIDFWKSDRLHVPNYKLCRNLIQNPSFESGMRYYSSFPSCAPPESAKHGRLYSIDDSNARFGKSSLKMRALKKLKHPVTLNTFAIPVKAGNKYSVSLYAKGDKPKGLFLQITGVSGVWPKNPWLGQCRITDKWKRYTFKFVAPNNAFKLVMKPLYQGDDKSGEGIVWVDGLQMEEGGKVTDFTRKEAELRLLSSDPFNFYVPGQPMNLKLEVSAKPLTKGSLNIDVRDFFNTQVWQKSIDFETDKTGCALVPLALDGKLPQGIFVVKANCKLANGFEDRDFFRISVMDKLKNQHKNKNICATGLWTYSPLREKLLERCRDIGFGATNYHNRADDKELIDMLQKYGIDYLCEGMYEGKTSAELKKMKKVTKVTPEMEKLVEEECYKKAKRMPWINGWFFSGESRLKFKLIPDNIKDFGKLLVAAYKGIKRANPEAKVLLTGGPCNMMPQNGSRLVERYIQAVDGKVKFDAVAIHPYRTTPEDPDLDDDAAIFMKMLERNGYGDVPVYWNEGIFYPHYVIPEWGLDSHKGCSSDHWWCGAPSYHMGWGEKIAAAYYARSWLVALKYQDRVKTFNGWSYWSFMDNYLTPFALQKIPNTLGHMLGDAEFKEDIRFAPGTRCYVFEDQEQRPVAAIWSHLPKVDRGEQAAPMVEFQFKGRMPEFIDLMGVPRRVAVDTKGFCEIPVTPFPLFVRGRKGELKELCNALRNGRLLKQTVSALAVTSKPVSVSEIELLFRNLLTRDFNGGATIDAKDIALKIPGKQSYKYLLPLQKPLSYSAINTVDIPVKLTERGALPKDVSASFRGFAAKTLNSAKGIAIDGNLDDWKSIPRIKITNNAITKPKFAKDREDVGYPGDMEASYKVTWNKDFLYLAVIVKDDKLVHHERKDTGSRWSNDSLQVYIDTVCDARSKSVKGFDGNDYNYDFFPNQKTGTAIAYRRFAPEQQAAGGLAAPKPQMVEPNVKSAFKQTVDGYIYEIAFPARYIAPMRLEAGSVVGFALFINDMDKKRIKNSLTLTPSGTGPYRNPHLYPVMLLTK